MTDNKVTALDTEKAVKSEEYVYAESAPTLTICVLTVDNGFAVVGVSACVDPANFDPVIGREIAYKDALGKFQSYLGFRLAEKLHGEKKED